MAIREIFHGLPHTFPGSAGLVCMLHELLALRNGQEHRPSVSGFRSRWRCWNHRRCMSGRRMAAARGLRDAGEGPLSCNRPEGPLGMCGFSG